MSFMKRTLGGATNPHSSGKAFDGEGEKPGTAVNKIVMDISPVQRKHFDGVLD